MGRMVVRLIAGRMVVLRCVGRLAGPLCEGRMVVRPLEGHMVARPIARRVALITAAATDPTIQVPGLRPEPSSAPPQV